MSPSPSLASTILRRAFVERVGRNSSYSLRAFARDLGVTHAYLSMILSGKRRVPLKRALLFSQRANLCEADSKALLASCMEENLHAAMSRVVPHCAGESTAYDFYRIEVDQFRVLADWYHLAILDLTLLDDFRSDPKWIARRLGIKTAEVRVAAARLARLGMLSIDGPIWRKTHAKVEVPTTRPEEAILRFHEQMIGKALEAARLPKQSDFDARDITGATMPVNPKRLPEAKRRIKRFRRALLNYVSEGKCTELYQLEVQLFPLTRRS